MKILIISLTFPPRSFGGVTEASFNISKNLAALGHSVTVYTTDVGNDHNSRLLDETNEIEGVHVRYFKNISNLLAFKHQIYLPLGFRKIIKEEINNFDIIQFQDFRSPMHVITWYYSKKNKIPYVIQSFGYLGHKFERSVLKKVFDHFFGYKMFSDANAIISAKTDLKEYQYMKIDENKISIVTNPLYDVDFLKPLSDSKKFKKMFNFEKHIILFLGRLHKIKGIEFLLDGFNLLCQDRDDVVLMIAGPDEGYKVILEEKIVDFNLEDKVIFTGILAGNDKIAALSEADMLVQTSISERGPGSPFEAILCGTPIIVTKNTGAGEIVEKIDAGYLVDYDDKKTLKDYMLKILDEPEEAINKMKKGRKYIINNLSWKIGVKEYENIYREVLNKKKI